MAKNGDVIYLFGGYGGSNTTGTVPTFFSPYLLSPSQKVIFNLHLEFSTKGDFKTFNDDNIEILSIMKLILRIFNEDNFENFP